ncbi:hypothetical protein TNCT_285061 [Trichonephila clavata]|uniref:Uncharacterized protein n=1 Tax=Trichonephila clavata TaxID=2740835 RepID=A0A8X6K8T7_TRICU|nr:hypothetical protein TNCT_285061 [Trichonephila clavata]
MAELRQGEDGSTVAEWLWSQTRDLPRSWKSIFRDRGQSPADFSPFCGLCHMMPISQASYPRSPDSLYLRESTWNPFPFLTAMLTELH